MKASIPGLMRTHNLAELNTKHIGENVTLCGWINKKRDLGGLHFIDLRDKFGITQINFTHYNDRTDLLKKCSLESVIMISGKVQKRPAEATNSQLSTGEIEVFAEDLTLLSRADIDTIPFLPYGATQASDDLRLKYRYLDLRTKKLQDLLLLRSKTMNKVRNLLSGEDFVEVETPILYKSTPEGARDYIVPSRVHKNHVYALPQSPQTLKQLLMIGGTDKYFQICRCFRDEDLRADRQPEFSQIDIEVSFSTQEYMKNLTEKILKTLFDLPENFTLTPMPYSTAMEKYGCDKPDVRFGLVHHNVTPFFKDSEFTTFKSVVERNGLIKAIFVPEKTFSRKETDQFTELVKPAGGKGVAFFKLTGTDRTSGIAKFISEEILNKLISLEKGDGTWLFFADANHKIAHNCADIIRRHLGSELKLYGEENAFLWVHDFPLLEWSEEDKRYSACHHPFTMPNRNHLNTFLNASYTDPSSPLKDLCAEAYDVVCNGYEIAGGSIRIYDNEIQSRMFEILGFSPEEAKAQFGFFIDALKYGVPPHGGMAFGLDRLIMILAKTQSITDVIAFPKTTSATDLMSQTPSKPNEAQLKELHFKWRD